ncbi:MAG TPA: hypothetical protein VK880_02165, partial [Anaerolineales bacterium]|nr:hypothetical protein [Anaerolineales bacterium]
MSVAKAMAKCHNFVDSMGSGWRFWFVSSPHAQLAIHNHRKGKPLKLHLKQASSLAIIFMLIFLGCATFTRIIPGVNPTPTLTSTPTFPPTDTPVPTKAGPCEADQTLRNLKSRVAYDEFVLFYNQVEGTSFLIVWFVDPEINPAAKESEITKNTD